MRRERSLYYVALYVGGFLGLVLVVTIFLSGIQGHPISLLRLVALLISFWLSTWGWKKLTKQDKHHR